MTPAHLAADSGVVDGLAALVEAGADVNGRCSLGFSPLAYSLPSCDCVRYLLGLPQLDLTAVCRINGDTMEEFARRQGHFEAADTILAEVCRPLALPCTNLATAKYSLHTA